MKLLDFGLAKPSTPPGNLQNSNMATAGAVPTVTGEGTIVVSAAGGAPEQITTPEPGLDEIGHAWPSFLPDGLHFLYFARSKKPENRAIYVGSLGSQTRVRLLSGASMPIFTSGSLLFQREGSVFAQQFDDRNLTLSGEPVLVADNVVANPTNGRGAVAASANGTLIYRSGRSDLPLTWVDRSGKTLSIAAETGPYLNPTLSPDEKRLMFSKSKGSDADLWILDLVHGAGTQFTTNHSMNNSARWSPDGKNVVYVSDRGGRMNLYTRNAEGVAEEEVLLKSDHPQYPLDWSSDGRYILYADLNASLSWDLWTVSMEGDHTPSLFLQTHVSPALAHFSPDGHWVLYQSNESGREELYIQSFPTPGQRVQISNGGGTMAKWRSDGKEIFYINGNALMSVDVLRSEANKALSVGVPRLLFQARFSNAPYPYDVSRDGQRFIIDGIPNLTAPAQIPITVVLNWPALLKK